MWSRDLAAGSEERYMACMAGWIAVGAALGWLGAADPSALTLEVGGPEPLVLGQMTSVPVRIRAPEEGPVAERPLRLSVNVGRFGPVRRLGPGLYESTYVLPEARFPQVAFVAAWRETGPDADVAFFRIPLHANTTVPVRAPSGSRIRVEVGKRVFGPVVARRGRAQVEIEVPPGVEDVAVISRYRDRETQARVSAGVPPYNRLTLAVSPYKVPSDGRAHATLHVFYDRPGGLDPERLRLNAPAGRLTPRGFRGRAYTVEYVPERTESRRIVRIEGRVRGDPASRASVELELGLPRPERIVAAVPRQPWVWDGETPHGFSVLVTDRLGLGVDGLTVVATSTVPGVRLQVSAEGEGRYRAEALPMDPVPFPPAGQVGVRVRVSEHPELQTRTAIPVDPAPWPTDLRIETEPRVPEARKGQTFGLRVWALRADATPYTGPLELLLGDAGEPSGPLDAAGEGLRTTEVRVLQPQPQIRVSVRTPDGQAFHSRRVELRRPRHRVTLAPRIGPLISEGLFLFGGAALEVRPGWPNERLKAVTRVGYWQREQASELFFEDGVERLNARLSLLPVSLGLGYEVWASYGWSLDVVALGTAAWGSNRVDGDIPDARREDQFLFGGAEAGAVLEVFGFTLDGYFGWLQVDEARVGAPSFYGGAALGYRFGL